jgi:hypothetical protein
MGTSTSARVQKHHVALRESDLRPVQIWVPDTRRPGFAEECSRQSLPLQDDAHEQETTNWLEATADREGWQ